MPERMQAPSTMRQSIRMYPSSYTAHLLSEGSTGSSCQEWLMKASAYPTEIEGCEFRQRPHKQAKLSHHKHEPSATNPGSAFKAHSDQCRACFFGSRSNTLHRKNKSVNHFSPKARTAHLEGLAKSRFPRLHPYLRIGFIAFQVLETPDCTWAGVGSRKTPMEICLC